MSRKRRGEAQLQFDRAGAPDPLDWLVERWSGLVRDKRVKSTSMSKQAVYAENLAFQLLPYLKPRLKATSHEFDPGVKVRVTIGGGGGV